MIAANRHLAAIASGFVALVPAAMADGNQNYNVSELELLDAASAPGRLFPVSDSVRELCTTYREIRFVKCRDPEKRLEFLAKFAREPRDIAWARVAEERLEKSYAVLDPEKFTVRALECRTTRCVIELAERNVRGSGPHSSIFDALEVNDMLVIEDVALGLEGNLRAGFIFVWAGEYRRASSVVVVDGRIVGEGPTSAP